MKKILCLMLTVLMTLSLFVLPAYAEATLPAIAEGDAIYAGEQSITIRLAETQTATALTEEQAALVKITKLSDNSNIEFTSVVTGDILTLIPAESFVINELGATDKIAYKLQLGNTTKLFTVDEIWKPDFKVTTEGKTNSAKDADGEFITDLDIMKGAGSIVDVIDTNTIVIQGYQNTILLDYPEIKNVENASLVADIYHVATTKGRAIGIFGFNISEQQNSLFDGKKRGYVSRAGWIYKMEDTPEKYHKRLIAIPDPGVSSISSYLKEYYGYSAVESPLKSVGADFGIAYGTNFGTTFAENVIAVGTATLPENFNLNAKYHYSIDKMGAVGTLSVNNQLVDVLDTQVYFDKYNTTNGTSYTAPTKGYFLITSNGYKGQMVLQNPRFITSKFVDFETADLTVESVEVEGDEATITFAGSENIDLSAAVVENYIGLSDGLTYDVVSKSGNTVVIKAKNIEDYTKSYTLTVKEGFGYETALGIYKVSADIVETVQFVKLTVAVPERVYAGAQTITVKYESTITETYVVGDISLTKDGEAVEFTTKVNGDILTIMPTGGLVINAKDAANPVTYELAIGGKIKTINVKELYKPSFAVETNSVKGLDITLGWDATFDVIDANTVLFAGMNSTIVLDYPEITNYENASFVADIYYIGSHPKRVSAAIGFNITDKSKNNLFYENKKGSVGRAGWIFQKNSSDANIKNHARMIAIPDMAATTSDPTKHFYGLGSGKTISVLNPIGSAFVSAYSADDLGTSITASKVVIGSETVALPEGFDTTKKYHYVIDKMGEVGTLMINGGLVDVLDTEDYYEQYNAENSASEVAPKTGYFLFTPYVQYTKMVMQNPRLITSDVTEFETGTIAQPTDIYANKNFMTVTFAEDVSKADTSKIVLTKDSVNVVCAKEINGNKVVITPVDGFELAKAYNITIGTDFGWDAKFLAEEYSKDFRLNKVWEADLSSGSIKTGVITKGLSVKASSISDLTYAVQNNKVYVQDKLQSSVAIYGIVKNISDYSLTYTAEYYATKANASTLFFNSTHANNAIEYAKKSELLGWKTLKRNFALQEGSGHFNATWKNGVEIEKPFNIVSTNNDVTFTTEQITNEDETVTEIKKVTLPAGETAKTYNYTLDKLGTKGILYVNNEYVDTNDIADLYEGAPSTGDIIIAGSGASSENANGGTIAFSNLLITTFELMSDRIVIENVTFLDNEGNTLESVKNATDVKGEATVKNLYNDAKPIKLIAIAYNADDEMIAVDILDVQSPLGANANASAEYNFTGLSGLTEIKVVAWDSFANLFPYCAPVVK